MAERQDFAQIIADIEAAGLSLYKIALMMRRQYIQIQRIAETGRCQHWEGEMLLEIHRTYVPLQNVPRAPTISMQMS